MNLCGDFLQLPPVEKNKSMMSLAAPLSDAYVQRITDSEKVDQESNEADKPKDLGVEAQQGMQLWRSVLRVVCLTVNVRAPGVLSRLQSEMRAGEVSDEMWALYMSRVIEKDDPRLTEQSSPFAEYNAHYIVHRHRVRVM
jgi:hypothetical protein